MSPVVAQSRRMAPKIDGPSASRVSIQRLYAPDLRRQVEALLLLLRACPNGDGRVQP